MERTQPEAFDEVTRCALELAALGRLLRAREHTSKTVLPHQALGDLAPQQFLPQQHAPRGQMECH